MTNPTTPVEALAEALRLPWHRETIGHSNVQEIAAQVARDLAVPLPDGIPAHTDATWIVNADNKIVAFVGNGPRQTENADAIIEAVADTASAAQALRVEIERPWKSKALHYQSVLKGIAHDKTVASLANARSVAARALLAEDSDER